MSKAGLVASLPARTAILGAANPAGGRYDRGRTMAENLKMSAAMLSRWEGCSTHKPTILRCITGVPGMPSLCRSRPSVQLCA